MNAADLIKAGRLNAAHEELLGQVSKRPGDLGLRTLLVQVLCFKGLWDKAEVQLDALCALDPKRETGVQVLKNLIQGERRRVQVCAGMIAPEYLPGAPAYAALHAEARAALGRDQFDEAAARLREIERVRAPLAGVWNGREFPSFRDTDDLLAPFLEAMVFERYVWVPVEAVAELEVAAPRSLTDLLWAQAQLACRNGLLVHCCLPVRYPGSSEQADERVQLGRLTDWVNLSGPLTRAHGQHVFAIGAEEVALLELGHVQFNVQAEA